MDKSKIIIKKNNPKNIFLPPTSTYFWVAFIWIRYPGIRVLVKVICLMSVLTLSLCLLITQMFIMCEHIAHINLPSLHSPIIIIISILLSFSFFLFWFFSFPGSSSFCPVFFIYFLLNLSLLSHNILKKSFGE